MTQWRIGTIAILFFVFYGMGVGATLTLGIQWVSRSGPWARDYVLAPISWQDRVGHSSKGQSRPPEADSHDDR
jgi:hypothetical protein